MTNAYRLVNRDETKDFEVFAVEGVFCSVFKRRKLRQLFGKAEKTVHIECGLVDRVPLKTIIKRVAEVAIKLHSFLEKPGSSSLIDWFSSARTLCSSLRGLFQ